jgi:hypothetical protein
MDEMLVTTDHAILRTCLIPFQHGWYLGIQQYTAQSHNPRVCNVRANVLVSILLITYFFLIRRQLNLPSRRIA